MTVAMAMAAWLLACPPPRPPAPEPETAPSAPKARPTPQPPPCLRIERLEIHKASRTLWARCERGAVVSMTVALSREPLGPKRQAGDMRTAEGEYRVAGPARTSRFHLFVPIDYPSLRDARDALADGRISQVDYEHILRAHESGLLPPASTPLGGGLGLHGEGRRWRGDSVDLDWTAGCFAVTDEQIEFLAERVEIGTPVLIQR